MIREAENARARIYDVQGNVNTETSGFHPYLTSLDEDYLMVGNHVDNLIRHKIKNGEYVDFAKLMPRD